MNHRSPLVRRAALLGLAGLLATLSCGREVTGPDARHRVAFGFAFDAHLGSADLDDGVAGSLVAFTKVRVRLNTVDGRPVIDQMVDFPAGADEVSLTFSIPISIGAPDSGETMALSLAYVNATGDTVFRGGPDNVLIVPTLPGQQPPPPVGITVDYTGEGSDAASVVIAPSADTVVAGDAFAFTANAFDAGAAVIPNTPIAWRTLDPALATVTGAAAGSGVTLAGRGVARIVAQLLTGPADTVLLTVLPKPAAIAVFAGNNQAAFPSQQLAAPVVVRVTATDAQPMAGITVSFAAADGGSVGSPSVVTDANGLAQTTWTLGPVGGPPQSLTATAAGLTGSPVTFTATAPALTLLHHYPMSGNVNDAAGSENGTLLLGAAVADGVLTPGGVNGSVAFGARLVPTIGSFSVSLFARNRAPLSLTTDYITQGQSGNNRFFLGHSSGGMIRAGEGWPNTGEAAPPIDGLFHHYVLVVDVGLNSTKLYVDGTLRQTLGAAIPLSAAGNVTELGFQYESSPPSMDGDLDEVRIYQGALSAAQISALYNTGPTTSGLVSFDQQPTGIVAGGTISPAVTVQVKDAMGRLQTGFNGNVSVAIGTNPAGGSLAGTTSVAAVNGVATFSDLSIDNAGAGYTLVASASGYAAATSSAFNVTALNPFIAWTNAAGGNWSLASNWSLGRVPNATDSIVIGLAGTYTVTLDVNFTGAFLTIGGGSGIQTLAVPASRTLSISDVLALNPTGALTVTNGSVGGAGTLINQGSVVISDATVPITLLNVGLVTGQGNATLSGVISNLPGGVLRARGSAAFGTVSFAVTNGFTNDGQIELTAIDGGYGSTFGVTNGTLTNGSLGMIISFAGVPGGGRTLAAQLDNQGTVAAPHGLTISKASAAHTNSGAINLSGGNVNVTQSGTTPSFTNTGTLQIGPGQTFSVTGGALDLTSGTVTGYSATLATSGTTLLISSPATARTRLTLASTTVPGTFTVPVGDSLILSGGSPNFTLVNNGTLVLQDNVVLNGTLTTSVTSAIAVRSNAAYGSTNATITNGFVNNGTIEMIAFDGGYSVNFGVPNGTLVNSSTGTITSSAGVAGGGRTLAVTLDNQGTLAVPYGLTLSKASAAHVNSGTINVSGANLAVSQSGTTPSFTNMGTITVGSGRTFSVSGGTLDLLAGLLDGPTGLLSTSGTTLLFTNTTNVRTRLTLASTTVPGTYTVPVGDSLVLAGGSPTFTLVNNGTLVLQDNVVLNGSLTTAATSVVRVRSNALYGSTNATITNGFTNNGTLEMIAFDGGYSVNLNVTTGTLVNSPTGTITSLAGVAGGGRTIAAVLDNQGIIATPYGLTLSKASAAHTNSGTINISTANLTVNQSGTTPSFTNTGTINVSDGRTFSVSGGTLDLSVGLLDGVTGTLSTSGTTLLFTSTAIVRTRLTLTSTNIPGTYTVPLGDSLVLAGGSPTFTLVNNGLIVLQDNIVLNGSLTTSSTSAIQVRSNALYGSTSATITNGFTNNGDLDLIAFDGGYSVSLTVTNGTLLNSPTGTITSLAGVAGGGRTISAQLDNQGTLAVPYGLTIAKASATHLNSGTINLTTANLTVNQSGTAPTFTNTGTVNVGAGRTFSVTGGTLDLTAGLVDGATGLLSTNALTLLFNSTATVRTRLTLTGTTVPGTYTVPAGDSLLLAGGSPTFTMVNDGKLVLQDNIVLNGSLTTSDSSSIIIRSNALYGSTNATITNAFTNNGAIELIALDGGYSVTFGVTNGTLVNSASGTITSSAGVPGGGRTLAAQLDNQGTLATPYGLTLAKASAAHLNSGSINVTGGNLTVNQSGTTPSFTNSGTITLSAGRVLSVSGGTLDLTAGALNGLAGTLTTNAATLTFTAPSQARTRLNLIGSTVSGTFTVPIGDSLVFAAGSPNFALINNGTIVMQDNVTLNGTLTTASTSAIIVRGNAEYGSTSAAVANGFTNNGTIDLVAVDGGYAVTFGVTTGTLVNSSSGTITSLAGVPGGGRTLAAALNNQGILAVPYGLTLAKASAAHTNSGTINVTGGNLTINQSGTAPSFTNTGTVNVTAGRTVSVSGGTFDVSAGLFSGPASTLTTNGATLLFTTATAPIRMNLLSTTVPGTITVPVGDTLRLVAGTLAAPVVNNGVIHALDAATISGALTTAAGSKILVRGNAEYGSLTFTVANGFTNNGVIEITTIDGGYTTGFTVGGGGTLTNAAGGTITTLTGAGGARTITAGLVDNFGAFNVNQTATAAAAVAQRGTLTVAAAQTFTVSGALTLHPGSTTTVSGTLVKSGGCTDLGDNTLTGATCP